MERRSLLCWSQSARSWVLCRDHCTAADAEGAVRCTEMSAGAHLCAHGGSKGEDLSRGRMATCLWGPRRRAAFLTGAHTAAAAALPRFNVLCDGGAVLVGATGTAGAAEQHPPGPVGVTEARAARSPGVPGLWDASRGVVRATPTAVAGSELPVHSLCRAELSITASLHPSWKEGMKAPGRRDFGVRAHSPCVLRIVPSYRAQARAGIT